MKVIKKLCLRCDTVKAPEEFPTSAHTKDGRNSWCRACAVEASRSAILRRYQETSTPKALERKFSEWTNDELEITLAHKGMRIMPSGRSTPNWTHSAIDAAKMTDRTTYAVQNRRSQYVKELRDGDAT